MSKLAKIRLQISFFTHRKREYTDGTPRLLLGFIPRQKMASDVVHESSWKGESNPRILQDVALKFVHDSHEQQFHMMRTP